MRGPYQEGHGWLERAIAQAAQVDPAARAGAFLTLANIANNLEDHAHARSLYEESLRICEEIGNERGVASALIGLGMVATNTGDYDRAQELLNEALERCRATESPATVTCLFGLGQLALARADYAAAERWLAEARQMCGPSAVVPLAYLSLEEARIARYRGNLAIATELASACLGRFREIGERRAEAVSLAELGNVALLRGDRDEALTRLFAAARLHLETRDELNAVRRIEELTSVSIAVKQPRLAARLASMATAWRNRVGTIQTIPEREPFDHAIAAARTSGQGEFDAAWRAGSLMNIEQALAEAAALQITT
jgi:tetratricopeptide (TPR) repeat protein